jgi:PEGA domain-containing protein/protein kinase-like protein
VFRTYEPTRDRLVAVKVFRLDIVPEQAQALAEALSRATQASLFHPSIVEPIASGVEGTVAYRAEEYVAAESLDVAMRHYAPAPIAKGLPFITQLAGAIDFARAAGVGHGGLHPRDIFVTPDEARATGFGVVEALERVGIRAPIRRPYTAPERIDGAAWSTAADVFSLAAIAFELLTGRRPAGTGAQIGALPDGPHRDGLHAVLARAMEADPSQRFPNALAFAGALESASRGEAVPAPAPAPAVPLSALPTPAAVAPAPPPPPASPAPAPAIAAAAAPAIVTPPSPTPGEFTVEEALDPMHAALADDIAAERDADEADVAERTLFDEPDHTVVHPSRLFQPAPEMVSLRDADVDAESMADLGEDSAVAPTTGTGDRFADDFVEEQQADAEIRRPLEEVSETVPPIARDVHVPGYGAASAVPLRSPGLEGSMFAAEPDPEPLEIERSRMPILPIALASVLCLLVGFGAGYFMRPDRLVPAATDTPQTAAVPPGAQPATSSPAPAVPGAAAADKPGQYTEQKVTPPSPVAESPRSAPPTEGVRRLPPRTAATAPARPAATTGRLIVQSTPSRASVTINGTWRGRTPLTLDGLSFGTYVVRVVQPGYRTAREEITLNARDTSRTLTTRLELDPQTAPRAGTGQAAAPAPPPPATASESFTGSIYVDSRPRGANVLVDGKSVGQTPLSVPDVRIGSHVVRIEMAGKKPWTATTRVAAGSIARVTGSLEDR